MKAKKSLLLFLTIILSSLTAALQGQVTIGGTADPQPGAVVDLNAEYKGGLLLANVLIDNLEYIPLDFTDVSNSKITNRDVATDLIGIVVYDTKTDGVYCWDGHKWTQIRLSNFDTDCNSTVAVSPDGGSITCQITDPNCTSTGNYFFNYIIGSEYSTLSGDIASGEFTLEFDSNEQALDRIVVLMVTSPCGNSNTYVYTQRGDANGCGSVSAPIIQANNPIVNNQIELCGGGAVYFYLGNTNPSALYIWTLNGEAVGYGANYQATQSGKYIVYANKIGCSNSSSVQVKLNGEAPIPVRDVIAANDGFVCNEGEKVTLYANNVTGGGIIRWYHEGVKTSETGPTVNATTGEWFAVVEDGTCSSRPSDPVFVQVYPEQGTDIASPAFTINGASYTGVSSICGSSIVNLAVTNVDPEVSYTWYLDNGEIGTGAKLSHPVTLTGGKTVLRCRATKSGSCPKESRVNLDLSANSLPVPSITATTGDVLCNGSTDLIANVMGSYSSYVWYYINEKNEVSILSGKTTKTITVNQTGTYRVSVEDNNCVSIWSDSKTIGATGFAIVSLSGESNALAGETGRYTASLDNPLNASYSWSVTNADIVSGSNTNSIMVQFHNAGTATISVYAQNACGNASPYPKTINVNVLVGVKAKMGEVAKLIEENLPVGSGVFAGKTKFDVAKTECGGASKTFRETYANYTDFSSSGATQSYIFTPSAAVTNVRFEYIESMEGTSPESMEGKIIESISPASITGTSITSVPFTIKYKSDLGSTANGKKNTDALTADIYAIYKTGASSDEKWAKMRIIIQDCLFCGAKTTSGGWLTFMCHNLGADETKSIGEQMGFANSNNATATTTVATVYGNIYQWGRLNDGHQLRTSTTTGTLASTPIPNNEGKFILSTNKPYDWITGKGEEAINYPDRWGDDQTSADSKGAVNNLKSRAYDPCPEGWKAPSIKQWISIFTNGSSGGDANTSTVNTWVWQSATASRPGGYTISNNSITTLFLPAGGERTATGAIDSSGSVGRYWSSTTSRGYDSHGVSYLLRFQSAKTTLESAVDPFNHGRPSRGSSVRCISEY